MKYVDFDFVLGADGVKVLKPKPFLHPKFFYYQLHTAPLSSLGYARHYRLLKEFSVSYPDLLEQQRIVAILDEAFAGITDTRAKSEQNLRNARDLFESYLQSVFARAQKNWPIVDLADLASDITDGDHMPPPKSSVGVPFITISNVNKQTHTVDFDRTFMVSDEYFCRLKPNKKPRKGDVLYTVTGSFGIPVRVEHDNPFCFQRHIGLVRPKSKTNSAWLYYLLLAPQTFEQAGAGATGTAQKTVSLKVLRSLKVPHVPLAEQRKLVLSLDAISAETQHLESIYQQKVAALDELKQSLLARAFAGDL